MLATATLRHSRLASRLASIVRSWEDVPLLQRLLRIDATALAPASNAGAQLEFIGVDGVGKTTLFNASVARLRSRWLFPHNLPLDAPLPTLDRDAILGHRRILEDSLLRIDRDGTDHRWWLIRARQLAVVCHRSLHSCDRRLPRGIAHHEGLFKNCAESVLALGTAVERLWRDRCFVHLRFEDPSLVVRHLEQRHACRSIPFDRHAILDQVLRQRDVMESLARRAVELGRPILPLQAEDDFQTLVRRVVDFQSSIGGEDA